MNPMSPINQYQRVDVESRVAAASPHNLVSMLLDGALKKIAIANGATTRGEVAAKGASISGAIRIIDNLRSSLDLQKGGDVAQNLLDLYNYMEVRLVEANRTSNVEILSEVSALLNEIRDGWDNMPQGARGV